ncbi:MAG: HAD family phosphatase [Planctomycetota bacterium]
MSTPILLLDVMGTLVYEPFYSEVPDFFGMSLKDLLAAKHPTAWAEFESGQIDEVELERKFFLDGREYDHAAMRDCMVEAYRFLDGIEELLSELSAAGVAMHALSNYPDWYLLIERKLQLSRFLEWSFVSCRTGHRKPDPEAYRTVVRKLGLPPDSLLFVDDREENCIGARREGLSAIRFEGAEALRGELIERGFLAEL